MKQLVLIGEGEGEASALPVLVRKLLREKKARQILPLRNEVLRTPFPVRKEMDFSKWIERIKLAAKLSNGGAILAVYDGDMEKFPPGSSSPFCAATAAKAMAKAAANAGAGSTCSLAVVFACVEYETWLIAGVESLLRKPIPGGHISLRPGVRFPGGDPESHGKGWLEKNCLGYRPARDQKELTKLLDLNDVRAKKTPFLLPSRTRDRTTDTGDSRGHVHLNSGLMTPACLLFLKEVFAVLRGIKRSLH